MERGICAATIMRTTWHPKIIKSENEKQYKSNTQHPDLHKYLDEHSQLFWWMAFKLSQKFGGSSEDYIASVAIYFNFTLYSYDEKMSKISTYMMRWLYDVIEKSFVRYESEGKSVKYVAKHTTTKELKELQVNYSFHEAEFNLYRIPQEDDDWALSIINEFDDPTDCFRFLTSDLNKRQIEIIKKRYVDNRTLEDIGKDYNITKEAVRLAQNTALRKIRKKVQSIEEWVHLFKKAE